MNILSSDGTFAGGQGDFTQFIHDAGGAQATVEYSDQVSVSIQSGGSMAWNVQVSHSVELIKDQQYTLCFDADAASARSFFIEINNDGGNEGGDGTEGFQVINAPTVGVLTGDPVEFEVGANPESLSTTFFATRTDPSARLQFSVGISNVDIKLDNIGLYLGGQCGSPSSFIEAPGTTLAVSNIPSSGRTDCPAPPPAEIGKQAPSGLQRELSNGELNNLLVSQTPFVSSRNWTLPWNMYEPDAGANNTTGEKFPMLLVLHGGYGSEGDEGNVPGNVSRDTAPRALGAAGHGLLVEPNLQNFPAYVISPNCRMAQAGSLVVNGQTVDQQPPCAFGSNEWASEGRADFELQNQPSLAGGATIELVEFMIENYDVDPARIYVTGLSMGGGGTWEMLVRRPDLFAAAIPVSGHTPAEAYLDSVIDSKIPVWAFAGSNDFTNPVTDTRAAAARINEGGGCFWLTEYQGVGHGDPLWGAPYAENDFWSWLFSQKLPASSTPTEPETADYEAPKTDVVPVIDGQVEAAWDAAAWEAIDNAWTGFGGLVAPESAEDFSGRYKAMWDANKLYVLVEITDDSVIDWTAEPTDTYWQDDTIEIFLDEDRSGGNHRVQEGANDANAFAYHLSTLGDNIDDWNRLARVWGEEHVLYRRLEVTETKSVWEMSITIWGDDYTPGGPSMPITLEAGKLMGFTMSYIDTDGNRGEQREHFVGSIDSEGHQNNEGFMNVDDIGSLRLVN